jgi:hypothetical protein
MVASPAARRSSGHSPSAYPRLRGQVGQELLRIGVDYFDLPSFQQASSYLVVVAYGICLSRPIFAFTANVRSKRLRCSSRSP